MTVQSTCSTHLHDLFCHLGNVVEGAESDVTGGLEGRFGVDRGQHSLDRGRVAQEAVGDAVEGLGVLRERRKRETETEREEHNAKKDEMR